MMDYNSALEDTMDNVNNIAQGYGFINGIDWAKEAQKRGEISWDQLKKYENVHRLRVSFSHGNARDIKCTYETYHIAKNFESDVRRSPIRKNRYGGNNSGKNGGGNKGPKLPSGTFRGKPYIKEFRRTGEDGEEYFFRFAIYKENNYLDDGHGGTRGFGYFIHIENAPYFEYASQRLHEFHMIKTDYGFHICWSDVIEEFDKANAVMFVWVKRYAQLIDELKKDRSISDSELLRRANKKHVLPSGTFRKQTNRQKSSWPMKTVYMTKNIYDQIMGVLGKKRPELGGMLGFTIDQDTIDTYVFDGGARVNSVEYTPDIDYLQTIIEGEWKKAHVFLGGFVHSHPGDFNRLSYADVEYAQRIMEAFELEYLFMPIVTSSFEYRTSITGYIVHPNGRVERCNISVVPGEEKKSKKKPNDKKNLGEDDLDPEILKEIEAGFDSLDKKYAPKTNEEAASGEQKSENDHLAQDDAFARISGVIDIPYMSECTVIGIGCGGSRSFYESMARMGVGNFYLMDGDRASRSNIASQNGYIGEIGLLKPELIKKRLLDINENIQVTCFNTMLTDELDDEWLEREIIGKIDQKKAVLCAFTDSFFAQARVSRIALKYRIPFISGQHYEAGTVSEVIFWYPGVTKYSMREIAKSRYEAYENGYRNTVTSVGSPIFNTTRLNALCEKIATGLLLYSKTPNHPYSSFLTKMSDKNLILIKQRYIDREHPLYDLFYNGASSFFDEASWINPESIEDLDKIPLEEGTVKDTRIIF